MKRSHTPISSLNDPGDTYLCPLLSTLFSTETKMNRENKRNERKRETQKLCVCFLGYVASRMTTVWLCGAYAAAAARYLSVYFVSHLHNYANDRNRLPIFVVYFVGTRKKFISICLQRVVKYSLSYRCAEIAHIRQTAYGMGTQAQHQVDINTTESLGCRWLRTK